jgi:hypothetical protein
VKKARIFHISTAAMRIKLDVVVGIPDFRLKKMRKISTYDVQNTVENADSCFS